MTTLTLHESLVHQNHNTFENYNFSATQFILYLCEKIHLDAFNRTLRDTLTWQSLEAFVH